MKRGTIRFYIFDWIVNPLYIIILLPMIYCLFCAIGLVVYKVGLFTLVVKHYLDITMFLAPIHKVLDVQKISDFLKYILPLTLTVYTFSYREKKQIAPSSIIGISEKFQFNLFLICTITLYIYGAFFYNSFGEKWNVFYAINVWEIGVLFSVILLIIIIYKSFNNINVNKLLDNTIKQLTSELNHLRKMLNTWEDPSKRQLRLINRKEKRIHAHIESIYQMLGYMNKNNMNEALIVALKEIRIPINNFNHEKFIKQEKDKYIKKERIKIIEMIYMTLFSNHMRLVVNLFDENKINRGILAIAILSRDLRPNLENNVLNSRFNAGLNEFILNFKMNNVQKVKILFKALEEMDRGKIEKIYETLLLQCIQNQDVKLLCNIVYPVTNRIDDFDNALKSGVSANGGSSMMMHLSIQAGILQKDIHLILKVLLKSIELGHHSCTGFLVKFLITRYPEDQIQKAMKTFRSVTANLVLDFTEDEQKTATETSVQKVDFNFNKDTFKYCFFKMVMLVYGQQRYAFSKKLPCGNERKGIYVDIVKLLGPCEYVEYLFEKIKNRKSKYGLVFLMNEKFMDSLEQELLWSKLKFKKKITTIEEE
ncbi:TPA: hypothetical protein RM482_000073 [Bacillus cereus]|nr:hypothetical protein [Bacillus cereus]HDW8010026.1 hypothetical protein [Bacillus cereus]HDW8015126.1 hypothetical protein [Bacillus cereus]HDW8019451.1 hypothetical protein [Bacillus cereus]HDW8026540.1 hypothetical protein [Bacillus cereus]